MRLNAKFRQVVGVSKVQVIQAIDGRIQQKLCEVGGLKKRNNCEGACDVRAYSRNLGIVEKSQCIGGTGLTESEVEVEIRGIKTLLNLRVCEK